MISRWRYTTSIACWEHSRRQFSRDDLFNDPVFRIFWHYNTAVFSDDNFGNKQYFSSDTKNDPRNAYDIWKPFLCSTFFERNDEGRIKSSGRLLYRSYGSVWRFRKIKSIDPELWYDSSDWTWLRSAATWVVRGCCRTNFAAIRYDTMWYVMIDIAGIWNDTTRHDMTIIDVWHDEIR